MAILQSVNNPADRFTGMTPDQLKAYILELEASKAAKISFKVSEKGALSIYGIGRFPVTLYLSQYEALRANWDKLSAFVEANRTRFASKPSA